MRTLTLTRKQAESDGIFSTLTREDGSTVAQTLEHAYSVDSDQGVMFAPKIPKGSYTCQRGEHRLHGMLNTFLTFEVLSVPNCTGILFHWGNYNNDSEGCILLGQAVEVMKDGKTKMVTNSRETFGKFMDELKAQDTFQLVVC